MVTKHELFKQWKVWANGLWSSAVSGAVAPFGVGLLDGISNMLSEGDFSSHLPVSAYVKIAVVGAVLGTIRHFQRSPAPDIIPTDDSQ